MAPAGAAPDPMAPPKETKPWQDPALVDQYLKENVPDSYRPYIQNPKRFVKLSMKEEGGRLRKLARMRAMGTALGYGQPQKDLQGYLQGQLQQPTINERQGESPMLGQLSS